MKQRLLMSVFAVLLDCSMTVNFSYAQAKGMYSANPYTGGSGGKAGYYNPAMGIYRPGVSYNSWTGKDVVNKDYYNAYTGASPSAKFLTNAYTGNYGSGSKGW